MKIVLNINDQSKEEAKSWGLPHNCSKRKYIVITRIKQFSCSKSWNNPLRNLVIYRNFIVRLFINDKWSSDTGILFLWVELWRKEMVSIFLWWNFGLGLAFYWVYIFFKVFMILHSGHFFIFWLMVFSLRLIGIIIFSFLFLRLPLYLAQFLWIGPIEAFVMEEALTAIFSYFVKVVHVKLSQYYFTCLTKEE